jgi:hypothetical protein
MVMAAIAPSSRPTLSPTVAGLMRWTLAALVLPVLMVAALVAAPFLLLTPGGAGRWRDALGSSPWMRRRPLRA